MPLVLNYNHKHRLANPGTGGRPRLPREAILQVALCHPDRKHNCYGLCKPCYRTVQRALYRVFCPKELKSKHSFIRKLRRHYGLTYADYEAMWEEQEGKCKICGGRGDPNKPKRQQLALDHCHEGGHVRGLLCWFCNNTLAYLENLRAPLGKYQEYLEKGKSVNRSDL